MSALKRKERDPCARCKTMQRICDGLFPDCDHYRRAPGISSATLPNRTAKSELEELEKQVEHLERKLENLAQIESSSNLAAENLDWSVVDPADEHGIPAPFNKRPRAMKDNWWDRSILAPAIRNYLINIAISTSSQNFTYFHAPTLFQSLELPDKRHQPHPAVLEALYLTACFATSFLTANASYSLAQHESHFLSRARREIENSLANCDRLLDCIKASNLVTDYLLMRGRYLEAFHQHAGASSLAISGGLHQIKTHVYSADDVLLKKSGPQLIAPPRNQLELGDRILTFWGVYMRDKVSGIITGFASGMADVNIATPLPREPKEYENSDVRSIDIERLQDMVDHSGTAVAGRRADTVFTSQLKGITLMNRAIDASQSPYSVEWNQVNSAIVDFLKNFVQTQSYIVSDSPNPDFLQVGTVAAVATGFTAALALHATLALTMPEVQDRRVSWAKSIVNTMLGVPLEKAIAGSAIYGYCFGKAAETLILHKKALSKEGVKKGSNALTEAEEYIARVLEAMKDLTNVFPTLEFQVHHVQRLVDAALQTEA